MNLLPDAPTSLASRVERIAVVLDEPAPAGGAFACGLDWAGRLRLPLHGVLVQQAPPDARDSHDQLLRRCAKTCASQGVAWTSDSWSSVESLQPEHPFERSDLCMVGDETIKAPHRERLFRRLRRQSWNLVRCPAAFHRVTRAIIVSTAMDETETYLVPAVQLCQAVGAFVVILTLAGSDREALCLQDRIEESLGDLGRYCDFDSLAGNRAAAAVVRIAQWRDCQLLVARASRQSRWLRWWRGDDRVFPRAGAHGLALIEMT